MKFKQWIRAAAPPSASQELERAGYPRLVAMALAARGVETGQAARDFLASDPAMLADPMLLRDMETAVARIERALAADETIAVYGDYDVDGITSTCLLAHYLRGRGGTVLTYIPDRLEEGYGLNGGAITRLKEQGVTLIITVDCGITAVAETELARALGVALVITDHHACQMPLPAAVAVVNPQRPDCSYPFQALAGVGVALKLVLAMGGTARAEELLEEYAPLAAMGTIADVMRLTGENRAIVSLGLRLLAQTRRPGLRALLRQCGLEGKPLATGAVGYSLAPRINAAGRMGNADLAVELLLTEDEARGEELVRQLCELNRSRQTLEAALFEECVERTERLPPNQRHALVLMDSTWHQGVAGIVASRLSERYACPAFVICVQDGLGRGSGRSYGGINLVAALQACEPLLESFGGHAQAAGFLVAEEKIPALREALCAYVNGCAGEDGLTSVLEIDGELCDPAALSLEAVEALSQLEPCGEGNPKPVFSLSGCKVTSLSDVGGGKHLKLRLNAGGQSLDAIFFSATSTQAKLTVGDRVDVAFIPQINEYRGLRTVQLQVSDLRPALTRAQAERALYERFTHGEPLSPPEAASLLPSREEFVALWKYLKRQETSGGLMGTAQRLARGLAQDSGEPETVPRTMVCLEVFCERGLIQLEHKTDRLEISLNQVSEKVNLEQSHILCKLRQLAYAQ